MLKDLISNACIIIACFYFSGAVLKTPLTHSAVLKRKISAGIFTGSLGIVLMLFSIHVTDKVIIDLRQVPLVLVAFYGGPIPALINAAIISLFRLVYFGVSDASILACINMVIVGFLCGYLSQCVKPTSQFTFYLTNLISVVATSVTLYIQIHDSQLLMYIYLYYIPFCLAGFYFANHVFLTIRSSNQLFQEYKRSSTTDFLTGLCNVRRFDDIYNTYLQNTEKQAEGLSLLLIDIDYFKKINDTYGHSAGDEILKQVASLLASAAGSFDTVSRNGGEEFSLILHGSALDKSLLLAERIRLTIEEHLFSLPGGSSTKITVSIGVASLSDSENIDLLEMADKALYKAKSTGRNKVCTAAV